MDGIEVSPRKGGEKKKFGWVKVVASRLFESADNAKGIKRKKQKKKKKKKRRIARHRYVLDSSAMFLRAVAEANRDTRLNRPGRSRARQLTVSCSLRDEFNTSIDREVVESD